MDWHWAGLLLFREPPPLFHHCEEGEQDTERSTERKQRTQRLMKEPRRTLVAAVAMFLPQWCRFYLQSAADTPFFLPLALLLLFLLPDASSSYYLPCSSAWFRPARCCKASSSLIYYHEFFLFYFIFSGLDRCTHCHEIKMRALSLLPSLKAGPTPEHTVSSPLRPGSPFR